MFIVFNVYIYFSGLEAYLEEEEFFSFIYSKYNREQIEKLEFEELACYISSTFQLPRNACYAILVDYLVMHNNILSTHLYESIMKELYKVDKSILAKRIEAFQKYDANKDGYISLYELGTEFTEIKRGTKRIYKPGYMLPINHIMEKYAMNDSNHLNFIGFNKYVTETVTNIP